MKTTTILAIVVIIAAAAAVASLPLLLMATPAHARAGNPHNDDAGHGQSDLHDTNGDLHSNGKA